MDYSITFSLLIASFIVYRVYLNWEQHTNSVQQIIHINSHNVQRNENSLLDGFLVALGLMGLVYLLIAST